MALLIDWVKQSVASAPGTSAISLGDALTGFIRFQDDSRIVDGSVVYYTAIDGENLERGVGTYTATGAVLSRTKIFAKLEAGTYSEDPVAGLDLSASAVIVCTAVSDTHNFRGCLVTRAAALDIPSGVTTNIMSWDTHEYDTDGFHSVSVEPTRLTIPAGLGIRLIRLSAGIAYATNAAGDRHLNFQKNGTNFPGQGALKTPAPSATPSRSALQSAIVPVADGDYFELNTYQDSGVTLAVDVSSHLTFFGLEVIE